MPVPGRSFRSRLQIAFVLLALAAVGITGCVASANAGRALRAATYDRLTASRETRRHTLERYFEDLGKHVVALSTSEATVVALQDLARAWSRVVPRDPAARAAALTRYYGETFAPVLAPTLDRQAILDGWIPGEPRTRELQYHTIAANPHPRGSTDLLLEIPEPAYGPPHARHHPTLQRYLSAFGFYDIFLITAPEGRVVYSVMKEIDIGADLDLAPYASTGLGRVYARATARHDGTRRGDFVIEDYSPYVPSALAPAAFIAAPVRVAGATVGVLAMQISIEEIDRVMTGSQRWRDEGLGETGQAYVIGADQTLRSDLRPQIEDPERFYAALAETPAGAGVVDTIRRNRTGVLTLAMDLRATAPAGAGDAGPGMGVNIFGTPVLRSQVALDIPDLRWTLVTEIAADEALAPVRSLQMQLLTLGLTIGAVFLVAAGWLGASVTGPVLDLARSVARVGAGARGTTVTVQSDDEIGQLAAAFNRMSLDLQRTTVSKTDLEVLAGRLITAQEDERRRVARELHDDLVQRLAAAAIEAGQLARTPASEDERQQALDRVRKTLSALSEDVHRLSRRLHPAMLEELGLVAGIEAECRAFMERGGPPVDLYVEGTFDDVGKEHGLALYRIAQEALRNAFQHANATDVSLRLVRGPDAVTLAVEDDGAGFTRRTPGWQPGLGLASMEERARLLGGTLEVASAPSRGTRVAVTLPLGDDAAGDDRVQAEDPAR